MQSPFEAVKVLAGAFRTLSSGTGGGGRNCFCSSGAAAAAAWGQGAKGYQGDQRKPISLEGVRGYHSYYFAGAAEASLFSFAAASSSFLWLTPPGGRLGVTSGGGGGGLGGNPNKRSERGVIKNQRRTLWGWLNSIFNR